jgi:hypothetical protein
MIKKDILSRVCHRFSASKCYAWITATLLLTPVFAFSAWFDPTWHYRVPITVPTGIAINSTIKVDTDFSALLATLGVIGTFDINSPRIVRPNDVLSTNQEFTDSVYAGTTDASGNSRGEVRFILEDAGPATYYLYFDITENGVKAANPQTPINGNFERGGTGTATPPGWNTSTRSNASMDLQIRPAETVSVTDTNGSPNTVSTSGSPYTGQFSYLIGYRTNTDAGGNALLTKNFTVPATSPGNLTIRFEPEGWDSAANGNTTSYDFIRVRLLNPATSAVLLNIAGPQLNNYVTCPFSPNYRTSAATTTNPGYGPYNNWDNGTGSNNHTLGMSATYNRGLQPWVNCSVNLTTVAGQAVRLEIRTDNTSQYRSWFLIDDVEWSIVTATLGTPETSVIVPGGFNAYETTTTPATAITGVIKTKIAGSVFNLDLIALNTAKTAIATGFTGAVKVELLDSSSGGILDGNGCNSNWPVIQKLATNPTFSTADTGRKTASFQENNAWPNVRVRTSYPATSTPTAIGCSTDNFAIRPNSFINTSASDNNWATAGTTRTLDNTAATGGNVHKAGQPFSMSATAVNALNTTTTNYTGIPSVTLSACLQPTSGCTLGTYSAGTWVNTAGVLTTSTASYNDAGAFTMQLNDASFASVDAADSNAAERTITSASFNVGRFVPDHFDLAANNIPQFRTFDTTDSSCNSAASAPKRRFTYIGQAFGYVTAPQATLTARNSIGGTTTNYQGTLWHNPTPTASYSSANTLDTALTSAPVATSNNNGTGVVAITNTDKLAYTRNTTTPQNPFNAAISLSINATDSSESVVTGNGTINTSTPLIFNGTGSGIPFDASNLFRYGRLVLSNANGAETLDLPVPMATQYWNGSNFVNNTDDNCTTLAGLNITLKNYTKNLAACETAISISGPFNAGKSNLKLLKPGAGNNGSVDLLVNLGATATGQTCTPTATTSTAAAQSYLQGKWSGTTYDKNPTARATFGIYKNANEFIYMREMY